MLHQNKFKLHLLLQHIDIIIFIIKEEPSRAHP